MSLFRLQQKLRKLAILVKHGWRMYGSLRTLRNSGIFDADYYLRCNPDIAAYAGGPLLHYALYGSAEHRRPSPLFDEAAYRAHHLELERKGSIALLHYLQHDDNDPNPWFDGKWYKSRYPDVNAAGLAPLAHFAVWGAREGRDPSSRFSSAYYLRKYSDVATSGVNPLSHFIEFGFAEGRLPLPPQSVTQTGRPVNSSPIRCLKRAANRKGLIALLVTHSPDGTLKPHVEHYLRALSASAISVTLLVAADRQFTASAEQLAIIDGLYVRRNEGFDFAAWAHLLSLEPDYYDADILYLLNDSLIGPFNQKDFDRVIARVSESRANVIGMTENFEQVGWHLQSYFIALKAPILHSAALRDFMGEINILDGKDEVINRYELRLTPILKQAGFECETLFVCPGANNPTILRWRELIEMGFPFVKVTTLRDHFDNVDTTDWQQIVRNQGYEIDLAERTIEDARAAKRSNTGLTIYGNQWEYQDWLRRHDTIDDARRQRMRAVIGRFEQFPLLSIVLLPDASKEQGRTLLKSLQAQLYVHWELLLPEDFDLVPMQPDRRIRTVPRTPKGSECGGDRTATDFNAALDAAQGDFVLPLPASVRLAEHAMFELAVAIGNNPEAALLYSDEDRIDAIGERCHPWFKTGWDPYLTLARDSIGLLAAYRTSLLRELGGMCITIGDLPLAMYELSLRTSLAVSAANIHHIPSVLCHRPTDDTQQIQDPESMRVIVRNHLKKIGFSAKVVAAPMASNWSWILPELPNPPPLVSIIVPTRDHADLLEQCVASLLSNTDYPTFELLVVDNDSQDPVAISLLHQLSMHPQVRVLPYPGKFNFAAMNNFAAREARGEVLVLLNNDTASIRAEWLHALVGWTIQPEVGAVGARLLYADGQLQHAGMVNQRGVGPVHQFRFADRQDTGPVGELCLTRSVTIVTGACLAIRRSIYFDVGGLDEGFRVAFNDVDLCMRLGDKGYRNVWAPVAELFHFEGASRGYDVTPEKQALAAYEFEHFRRRWGSLLDKDPFSNPNLYYGWDRVTLAAPPL